MSDAKPTVLAIDDAESVRRLLEDTLGKSHLVVKTAPDARSALAWAQLAPPPELVLLDTEPAGMSGYDLCKALRALPGFAAVPVIFLSERRDAQVVVQAFQLGALDLLVKPLAAGTLLLRVRGHLASLARQRAAGLQGAELRIARLLRAMHAHESSLDSNRAQRLAQYARALALAADAREGAAELLGKAAPVHDVGKLAVPPELLRKERVLAGAEREHFERHAAFGADIIGDHEDALLKLARTLALTHHEHWDGSGYPGRLQGSQIPSAGRVMAIVDAFESMTAAPYGGSRLSTQAAVAQIGAGAGKQFDPALVEALRKAVAVFDKIRAASLQPAAEGSADLVIGETSARPAADTAAQPTAADDDIVIGRPGPARDPADDAGLTMIGPLRLRSGAASSDNQIREAVQRAVAKAQSSERVPPAAEEKPAMPALDLKPEEPSPPPTAAVPDEPGRAQETPAQAQKDRAAAEVAVAQARAELQANKGVLAKAEAELEALRARISELEAERNSLNARIHSQSESLAKAHGELEALRGRLSELEAEAARSPSAAEVQLQEARSEAELRINEARREVEALRGRVGELEVERSSLNARIDSQAQADRQLKQAHGELERLRAQQVASSAELQALNSRIVALVSEHATAVAALGEARAEIEGVRASSRQLESRVSGAEAARSQVQADLERARIELGKETDGLRRRIDELQSERDQQRAELEALRANVNLAPLQHDAVAQSEARLAESQAALSALEARVADALAKAATPVPAAPQPIGTRLLVAFLSGALVVVITFVLLHR